MSEKYLICTSPTQQEEMLILTRTKLKWPTQLQETFAHGLSPCSSGALFITVMTVLIDKKSEP